MNINKAKDFSTRSQKCAKVFKNTKKSKEVIKYAKSAKSVIVLKSAKIARNAKSGILAF